MNVFKSLPSTLLLLTAFSLGSSFTALACEDETQAGAGIKKTTPHSTKDKEERRLDIVKQLKTAAVTVRDNSDDFALLMERPDAVKAYIAMRQEELWYVSHATKRLKEAEIVQGPYSSEYFEALRDWGKEHDALIKAANAFQRLLDSAQEKKSTESKTNEEKKS